jgi:hypothetical protein
MTLSWLQVRRPEAILAEALGPARTDGRVQVALGVHAPKRARPPLRYTHFTP